MQSVITRHWAAANARDWPAFTALLHPHLRYDVPQTREFIEGGVGYLELFRTWPGAWHARVTSLICDDTRGVSVIEFADAGGCVTGISIFSLENGVIIAVTDYWPESYEPPPRSTPHLQRRPA